ICQVGAKQLRGPEVATTKVCEEELLVRNEEVENSCGLTLANGCQECRLVQSECAEGRQHLERLTVRALSRCRIKSSTTVQQVESGALKVLEEPTREDSLLIDINSASQLNAAVTNVSDLSDRVPENLTLDANVPLLHIRRAQIRIDREQRGKGIFICEDIADVERQYQIRYGYRLHTVADRSGHIVLRDGTRKATACRVVYRRDVVVNHVRNTIATAD